MHLLSEFGASSLNRSQVLCRQAWGWAQTQTQTQTPTYTYTDAGNDDASRPKLASGKKQTTKMDGGSYFCYQIYPFVLQSNESMFYCFMCIIISEWTEPFQIFMPGTLTGVQQLLQLVVVVGDAKGQGARLLVASDCPTDSPTATKLGLCNSLSSCLIPHWQSYSHQARTV